MEIIKDKVYKHFKGDLYLVVDIAEHTETGEQMVIYRALYGDCKLYARPLEMFASKIDTERAKKYNQEYRFVLADIETKNKK